MFDVMATIVKRHESVQRNLKRGAIPRINQYDKCHRVHNVYGLPDSPRVIPRLHPDPLTGLDPVLSEPVDPRQEGRVVAYECCPKKGAEIVGRPIDVGEAGRRELFDNKAGLVLVAAKSVFVW